MTRRAGAEAGPLPCGSRYTFESDWRSAPMAFWVHVPVPGQPGDFAPPAPRPVPHRGYRWLHVAFRDHELVFSAPAQLDHFIDVMTRKPLPTSRQLSARRSDTAGPNGHWLSRLPARLKTPKAREALVRELQRLRAGLLGPAGAPPADWPPAAESA